MEAGGGSRRRASGPAPRPSRRSASTPRILPIQAGGMKGLPPLLWCPPTRSSARHPSPCRRRLLTPRRPLLKVQGFSTLAAWSSGLPTPHSPPPPSPPLPPLLILTAPGPTPTSRRQRPKPSSWRETGRQEARTESRTCRDAQQRRRRWFCAAERGEQRLHTLIDVTRTQPPTAQLEAERTVVQPPVQSREDVKATDRTKPTQPAPDSLVKRYVRRRHVCLFFLFRSRKVNVHTIFSRISFVINAAPPPPFALVVLFYFVFDTLKVSTSDVNLPILLLLLLRMVALKHIFI